MTQTMPSVKRASVKVWQFDPAQITTYYNNALCDALALAGAEVTYLTSRYLYDDVVKPNTFTTEYVYFRGLDHHYIRRYPRLRKLLRGVSYPLGHREALRLARKERPEIVHIQWSRLPRFDGRFIQALRSEGIPVVHTVHDIVPLYEHPDAAQAIGAIYAMCDALIVHGDANKSELLNRFPELDSARIYVVPHISLRKMFPTPASATPLQAREHLELAAGIPENAFVFLLFGNLKNYKGADLLIDAFARIQGDVPDAHLVLAGKVDESLDLPVGSLRVHVLPRYIPTADMWRVLMGADVAVFPYRQITQSGALITAMGFGLPAIVTNVGALPETLDQNGWIVSPSSDALSDALLRAAQQRASLPSLGRRSLELIESRHAQELVGRKLLDIYMSILD